MDMHTQISKYVFVACVRMNHENGNTNIHTWPLALVFYLRR